MVVGAGFVGLAAARRLAENRPSSKIILIEAQEAGEGASGRNSGFVIDVPHKLSDLNASRCHLRLNHAGIDYLRKQVEQHKIACDWSQAGKYQAAITNLGVREILEPTSKEFDSLGQPYIWCDRAELKKRLGSDHFTAAIYTPGTVLVNPAALTRGLADTLPENVTLFEQSPVIKTDYNDKVELKTPNGSISAGGMILAVNSFAEQFGFYQGRLLVFAVNASLSRCLTQREYEVLGRVDPWGLTPANPRAGIGATVRLTPDLRILIRQTAAFCPSFRQSDDHRRKVQLEHKRLLNERFPLLPEVNLEYTWTGYICVSGNGSPGFGRVAPNVYAAVCDNGVGVVKGTISGLLGADMACGLDNPLIADMQALGAPNRLPPRPFLDIGAHTRLAWSRWRGRVEE
ncbi:NAD(P)/FAD-dependent oxidoreductase [Bradyrhizobium sp. CCBAU 11434]|uniref:NAD(P)/FAD-dependent oxidoreductase n=1 Tax=Bradyrhizobium sp. CCBAU 11434 TaxID=1630885 RepID=UPI002306A1C6|nr:FAD-binding oxidoreductase [Bradyrhizobium sp. CCBAU 11434]